eukprot:3453770-Amphidinium_carterae.2
MLFRSNKKGLVPETDSVGVDFVDDGEVEEGFYNHFSCIGPSEHDEAHEGEGDDKAEADEAIMEIVGLPKQKKAAPKKLSSLERTHRSYELFVG